VAADVADQREAPRAVEAKDADDDSVGRVQDPDIIQILFQKARLGKHKEVTNILSCFVRGKLFPVDVREPSTGNTVTIVGAANGHKLVCKASLRLGADINAQNRLGNTPLHSALDFGYDELAGYLVSKGADRLLRNAAGHVPGEKIRPKELPPASSTPISKTYVAQLDPLGLCVNPTQQLLPSKRGERPLPGWSIQDARDESIRFKRRASQSPSARIA
jgi:hypothetical protein